MSTYRVADGHDIALGSLTVLSPQPASQGVKPTRRNPAADGAITEDGLYVELEWSVIETAADYLALLTTFGLHNATSNDITIYARDSRWVYTRYNGKAIVPELGRDADWQYFARNVTILVKNLQVSV